MKTWAESKQIPGQFTGSTGVKLLTPAELSSGYQAWARKVKLLLRFLFHSTSQDLSGSTKRTLDV